MTSTIDIEVSSADVSSPAGSGERTVLRIRHTLAATIAATLTGVLLLPTIALGRTIRLSERANIHRVSHEGGVDRFAGTATGTLPGNVAATLRIGLTAVTGTVTFYPRGGTLTVAVRGKPQSLSRVSGTMTVTRGTGKFAGARGSATFSGTLNRRTWRGTVSATGRLTY